MDKKDEIRDGYAVSASWKYVMKYSLGIFTVTCS